MLKTVLSIIALLATLVGSYAQEPVAGYEPKTWIMGVPQHLFNNGIRIEIDKKIPQTNFWLTAAPVFYYKGQRGNRLWGNYDVHQMQGLGLELFFKWYPVGLKQSGGAYLMAGGGYQMIRQEFRGYRWNSYVEDDLNWYVYDETPWNLDSHSATIKATAGYMAIADDHLALDLFIGWGFKYSQQSKPSDTYYNIFDDVYSFGGNGFLLIMGFRVGVGW